MCKVRCCSLVENAPRVEAVVDSTMTKNMMVFDEREAKEWKVAKPA